MKTKELQKKKDQDLFKLLKDKQESLREFRFGVSGGGSNNTSQAQTFRREIAQILTELNSRTRS
ncbi:MAG: 50S ribosomal protein L29 [Candidatus Paceibacterota bacterium]